MVHIFINEKNTFRKNATRVIVLCSTLTMQNEAVNYHKQCNNSSK